MENINIKASCKASGTVSGILYVVCAFFYRVLPEKTIGFFNYLFHGMDLNLFKKQGIGFGDFFIGLIILEVGVVLATYLFVILYNKFNED